MGDESMSEAARRLVASMGPEGYWSGELSSSALSTATAMTALELCRRHGGTAAADLLGAAVGAGASWLCRTQNEDGGWGDTVDSRSNISTTTLCWAALALATPDRGSPASPADGGPMTTGAEPDPETDPGRVAAAAVRAAESWLRRAAGDLTPLRLAAAISQRYGDDRTFSVPILTMCALAGRLGPGRRGWAHVAQLPFELAALPRALFGWLGLPVVSYALPALIAIGIARHHHRPSRNPLTRLARAATRARTLRLLESIQPAGGGFLEATPLTSFVTMSLVGSGLVDHAVVRRALAFLIASQRHDGSWPIDTNLATWVTTQSINALAAGGRLAHHVERRKLQRVGEWLLGQQYRRVHTYTGAAPGGWAWTDLPGGVPDADDTAGALLALHHLAAAGGVDRQRASEAAALGVGWLLGLQNRDGGIPTFCRGWGRLPFDRSGADLTAHALRAWNAWRDELPHGLQRRLDAAVPRAVEFLLGAQRDDGAWVPLWFGNQAEPAEENPVYGTAAVLRATDVEVGNAALTARWRDACAAGRRWLAQQQHRDGGWGGGSGIAPTIEETGVALAALAAGADDATRARACEWLRRATEGWQRYPASPIGLYFANLWYDEALYPLIFATAALEASAAVARETASTAEPAAAGVR